MARRKQRDPMDEFLWVEKYRPQTLKDCIIPDRLRDELEGILDGGELNNLLFAGPPGVGKTTVAKALARDLDMDSLVINASKDGNIDTLRTTIQNFAMSKSFGGKRKVVIMDEADYLNPNSTQPALRNFIEEYSRNCRFLFTANYPKKIIDPLHSRLREVNFHFSRDEQKAMAGEFRKHFVTILKKEGIKLDKDNLKEVVSTVDQVILKYGTDYRKMLGELQGATSKGELRPSDISTMSGDDLKQVADWILDKNFTKCREWAAENMDIGFTYFMKVREHLEPKLDVQSIPTMFTVLNEYDCSKDRSSDPEVHMVACIADLMVSLEG